MNKQDFRDQIKARQEEIDELEYMVQKYGQKIKNVSALLRANMITAFRQGVIDTIQLLDGKAINAKMKRDIHDNFVQGDNA